MLRILDFQNFKDACVTIVCLLEVPDDILMVDNLTNEEPDQLTLIIYTDSGQVEIVCMGKQLI